MNGEVNVSAPPIFSGDAKDKTYLSAKSYLLEVDARNNRRGQNVTDAHTIQWASSCLRGSAQRWFNHTTKHIATSDQERQEKALILNDYTAFKKAFSETFGIGGVTKEVNWKVVFNQQKGETAQAYFQRACTGLAEHLFDDDSMATLKGNCFNPPPNYATISAAVQDADIKTLVEDAAKGIIDARETAAMNQVLYFLRNFFHRQVLVNGLTNTKLQEMVPQLRREHTRNSALWARIAQEEVKLRFPNSAAETAVVTSEEVNAANTKKKGKGKNPAASCDYCAKNGHVAKDCYTKKRAENKKKGISEVSENTATPGGSSQTATNNTAQIIPQGNASGW